MIDRIRSGERYGGSGRRHIIAPLGEGFLDAGAGVTTVADWSLAQFRVPLPDDRDAGPGTNRPGPSRLPPPRQTLIAAVVVAADTVHIDDARSVRKAGRISPLNASAGLCGRVREMSVTEFIDLVVERFGVGKLRSTVQ